MYRILMALGLALPLTQVPHPVRADTLAQAYEAASVALETEIFRASGRTHADAARQAAWDNRRRAASLCALAELERLRGRAAAERYVTAYAAASRKAKHAATAGEIMGHISEAHRAARLDLRKTLVPITQRCGIGL